MDVVINANDVPFNRGPHGGLTELANHHALFQGIDAGEVLFHEGFIHHGDRQTTGDVLFGEAAPPRDLYPKGPKIIGRDHGESGTG